MADGFDIGAYVPGEEDAIVDTFQRVFGTVRPVSIWRWLHLDNPAGTQIWVARAPDGTIAAQFAGIPRRVRAAGEVVTFSEIVDSFTHPDYRRGLQRTGLFVKTALPFVEHHGRPDRNVVMYGLPNPQAYRIGARFIGYTPIDDDMAHLMTASVESAGPADPACGEEVVAGRVDRFSQDTTWLDGEIADRHEITTVRDAAYMNWRYADHPAVDYELIEARECDGKLLAAIALRHRWCDEPVTMVCDALVRPHPAFPGLMRYLSARAAAEGSTEMRMLVRDHTFEYSAIADLGWAPQPSHFRLVCGVYRDDMTVERLRDRWHVTLGDFDVC